jgi:hypothetical protein
MLMDYDGTMGWLLILCLVLYVIDRVRQFFKRREDRWIEEHNKASKAKWGNTGPVNRPISEEEIKRGQEMYEVWQSLREEDRRRGPGPPAQ